MFDHPASPQETPDFDHRGAGAAPPEAMPDPPTLDVAPPPFASPPPAPPDVPPRPRIWTVVLAICVAVVAVLAGQLLIGALMGAWVAVSGEAAMPSAGTSSDYSAQLAERIQAKLMTPMGLILIAAPTQIVILSIAMLAASCSPVRLPDRLGLRLPTMRWRWYPIFALATIIPFVVSIGCAALGAKLTAPPVGVEQIWNSATWLTGAVLVAFIALAPGFCEELFFRGYVQRRLLARWSPWAAIVVASLVFAIFHVLPAAIALAFPLGIWLGVLAWRTGSIWPGAVCHAFVNGTWNAVQIGGRLMGADMTGEAEPTAFDWSVLAAIFVIGLACFVLAVRKLRRCAPGVATAA